MSRTLIADRIEPIMERYDLPLDPVMAAVRDRFRPSIAFATGSFVEGHAGPTSDMDIRAVCCPSSEHPEVDRSFRREDLFWCGSTFMGPIAGRPVHIIYWPEDVIESLRRKIDDAVLDSEAPLPVFTAEQVEFLEEIEVAVPLIGADRFEELRRSLALETFAEIRMQQLQAVYDQTCGETEGPMRTGNNLLAAVRSSRAVNAAVDCYLYAHGRRVGKEKWRLRELIAVHDREHEVVQQFLRFTLGGFTATDDEALADEVRERLSWCNELMLAVQV